MKKLLVITGPTATGKTALAIKLAKKFNGEILSADSRQVYKFMDIGTGKDRDEYKRAGIKVWGLDLVEPGYNYNVSEYVTYAKKMLGAIWNRRKLPIIVGGTGLYIRAILQPLETISIPPNRKLRDKLLSYSLPNLQEELQKFDNPKWQRMSTSDRKNPRRLIRAIEVALIKPETGFHPVSDDYDSLIIGLTAPGEILFQRIDARVEKRIKMGVEKEKKELEKMGYFPNAFGYKDESVEKWKKDEHGYAKRQLTYLRKLQGIFWFNVATDFRQEVFALVRTWYSKLDGPKESQTGNPKTKRKIFSLFV